jgi:hypothetical protein
MAEGHPDLVVYLAGDWKNPPANLADSIEQMGGYTVSPKWWIESERVKRGGNLELLMEEVSACDLFVMDMRGERYGDHYYAGCHLAAGIASAQHKPIYIVPDKERMNKLKVSGDTGTYTSLLASRAFTEEALLSALRMRKRLIE